MYRYFKNILLSALDAVIHNHEASSVRPTFNTILQNDHLLYLGYPFGGVSPTLAHHWQAGVFFINLANVGQQIKLHWAIQCL